VGVGKNAVFGLHPCIVAKRLTQISPNFSLTQAYYTTALKILLKFKMVATAILD